MEYSNISKAQFNKYLKQYKYKLESKVDKQHTKQVLKKYKHCELYCNNKYFRKLIKKYGIWTIYHSNSPIFWFEDSYRDKSGQYYKQEIINLDQSIIINLYCKFSNYMDSAIGFPFPFNSLKSYKKKVIKRILRGFENYLVIDDLEFEEYLNTKHNIVLDPKVFSKYFDSGLKRSFKLISKYFPSFWY